MRLLNIAAMHSRCSGTSSNLNILVYASGKPLAKTMITKLTPRGLLVSITLAFTLAACQVNPVTGQRHFQVYGSDWENSVGAEMYQPLKQSQGGDYVLDEELTAYVQQVGNRIAKHARRSSELDFEFSVLNDSSPNAWALPGGKIVINRGLLTELGSEAELAAVLAHEIVHADAAHGARQQSSGMLAQLGAVASMVVLGSTIDNPNTRELAMLVPAMGAQLIMQRYGRDAERESDEYGMRYMSEAGYDPQGAVDLQRTFVELSKERREDWLSGLFASHPPSRERVENNIRTARKLPAGGEVGRERYLRATRHIRETKPAYEAYAAAGKALKDDNLREAQRQLDRDRAIEPREPLFLVLEGDILGSQDKDSQALQAYDRAISANPNFFYPYLRKGQLEYQGGRYRSAGVELEKSTGLLPTSEALYLLGMIRKRDGNRDQAVRYLSQAAESNSAAGKKAKEELARMQGQSGSQGRASDISRYVPTRAAQDADGYVWVQLANRADVALKDIQVETAWIDNQGQTRRDRELYAGPLRPGGNDQFRTGIRLPRVQDLGSRVRVRAISAQRY